MKKPSSLAAFVLITISLLAQKGKNADQNLPPFGKVDKSDLEMKLCDFDDKAEALVLVDDGQLEYVNYRGMVLQRRIRIKILNDKGLKWANVHLKYRSERNGQDISGLEAQTY